MRPRPSSEWRSLWLACVLMLRWRAGCRGCGSPALWPTLRLVAGGWQQCRLAARQMIASCGVSLGRGDTPSA